VEGVEERRVLHLFAVQWGEFVNPIDPQPRFTDGTFQKDVRHSVWQDENWLTKCKPIWFFHLPFENSPVHILCVCTRVLFTPRILTHGSFWIRTSQTIW
jgi:hypothetical protein